MSLIGQRNKFTVLLLVNVALRGAHLLGALAVSLLYNLEAIQLLATFACIAIELNTELVSVQVNHTLCQ